MDGEYFRLPTGLGAADHGSAGYYKTKPTPERTSRFSGAGWSEERIERLKKLWSEGLSCSIIAIRLGGVSRNGVIGKIHRLGLSGRATVQRKASGRKPRAQGIPRKMRADGQPRAPVFAQTPLPPEPERPANLIALADLQDHQCRFPFGDGITEPYGFCGCQKATGSSYCLYHAVVCSSAPVPRPKSEDVRHKHRVTLRKGYTEFREIAR